jgi:hypothetical protein
MLADCTQHLGEVRTYTHACLEGHEALVAVGAGLEGGRGIVGGSGGGGGGDGEGGRGREEDAGDLHVLGVGVIIWSREGVVGLMSDRGEGAGG